MFNMVDRLRALRGAGRQIFVTTFQHELSAPAESQGPYEIGLAESLSNAFDPAKYDLAMVLVGNLHARRMTVTHVGQPAFDPMAMHLPGMSTLTLNAATGNGEAWTCEGPRQSISCGAHKRENSPLAATSGVVLDDRLSAGYDGIIGTGSISASPPIGEP